MDKIHAKSKSVYIFMWSEETITWGSKFVALDIESFYEDTFNEYNKIICINNVYKW